MPPETFREVIDHHSRLLSFTLGVEEARDYWEHRDADAPSPSNLAAFEGRWFGARSEHRVMLIMRTMRARFDAFPHALRTLTSWPTMDLRTRQLICHWHAQLADPTYRAFTGQLLPERLLGASPDVTLELVADWVRHSHPSSWQPSTIRQMASKLLSTAHQAGLLDSTTDRRRVLIPHVPDEALGYLMYLLRTVDFQGTLLDNLYLRSVGLEGLLVERRLRALPDPTVHRQGDLVEIAWTYHDLDAWGAARL